MKALYKNRFLTLTAIAAITAAGNTVAAQGENYFGLQYNATSYDDTSLGVNLEFDSHVLIGRFGSILQDNLALEGRFGIGLSDDTLSTSGTGDPLLGNYTTSLGFEIDTLLGIYGLGRA